MNDVNDMYAPSVQTQDAGKNVLILTDDTCHDLEFFYPYYRMVEEGCRVDVATPKGGLLTGKFGMKLQSTLKLANINPDKYGLLYIPGGQAPERLRKEKEVLAFVEKFAKTGKPIAAICHGAQVLVSAGLVKGHRLAAWPEVEKEITAAGGNFVNAPLVEDGQFITARWPGDLPSHMRAVLKRLQLKTVDHSRQSAA